MTREEKHQLVGELSEKLANTDYFYIADASGLTVSEINDFRKMCFEKGLEYRVVKNTLISKALETLDTDYTEFSEKVLKGFSGNSLKSDNYFRTTGKFVFYKETLKRFLETRYINFK